MLPKKERLTQKEFKEHFGRGKRLHGKYVQLIIFPSPTFHGSVVVGKKVSALANKRNRMRRVLYDTLRRSVINRAHTYIVILKSTPSLSVAKNELISLLKKTF